MKKFLTLILLCVVAQITWAQTVVSTDADLRSALQVNNANIQLGADIDLSNSTLSTRDGKVFNVQGAQVK